MLDRTERELTRIKVRAGRCQVAELLEWAVADEALARPLPDVACSLRDRLGEFVQPRNGNDDARSARTSTAGPTLA